MDSKLSEGKIERLLRDFLSRENSGTSRNYQSALDDFCVYAKSRSRTRAITELLRTGSGKASARVARYKTAMLGKRDARGKVISGRGLSAAAVNLRLTVLRSIVKKARRTGLVDWELDVPNVAHEAVHDVRGPESELLNQMLDAARARPAAEGRRDYAILRLAAELGLRRREIIGLDLEDFDPDAAELKIHGKGRLQKETVACSEKSVEAIKLWLEVRPLPRMGSPLFTNLIPGRAARISGPAIYLIVRRLAKSVLPSSSRRKIGPHKIRHSAITSAVRLAKANGLAREEVQKFSRHKDFRMVARYLDAHENAQSILARANGKGLR